MAKKTIRTQYIIQFYEDTNDNIICTFTYDSILEVKNFWNKTKFQPYGHAKMKIMRVEYKWNDATFKFETTQTYLDIHAIWEE